jgi:hypothetical protein
MPDLDRDIAGAKQVAHQRMAALGGKGGYRLRRGIVTVHQDEGRLQQVGNQRRRSRRVDDEVEHGGSIPEQRPQVRFEMNHDAVFDTRSSGHANRQRLAHTALGTIAGQHVAARNLIVAAIARTDRRRNPGFGLVRGNPAMPTPQLDRRRGRDAFKEDILEERLRNVEQRRRRESERRGVLPLIGQRAQFEPGQPGYEAHVAAFFRWHRTGGKHAAVDAQCAANFQRSGIHGMGARRPLPSFAAFENDAGKT